jgi:hypothetical protein
MLNDLALLSQLAISLLRQSEPFRQIELACQPLRIVERGVDSLWEVDWRSDHLALGQCRSGQRCFTF